MKEIPENISFCWNSFFEKVFHNSRRRLSHERLSFL
ncbi:hypothetical protein [Flammeovirga sp. OC4]